MLLKVARIQLFMALVLACGLLRPVEGQTLPFQGTATSSSILVWITQLGLGPSGEFEINNIFNTSPALIATTNGTGPALQASSSGSGPAGVFEGLLQTSAFQLTTAPSAGYVLTSDATGRGTWQPAISYVLGAGLSLNGNVVSIATGGVTSAMLANGAVTSSKIAAGAVTTSAIANGAITSAKLANGAVGTAAIANGAITSAQLANGAVTTSAIANGAVTAAQLASGAVTAPAIANGAVTTPAIAAGAVTTATIANGAVTSAQIDWPLSVTGNNAQLYITNTFSLVGNSGGTAIQATAAGGGAAVSGTSTGGFGGSFSTSASSGGISGNGSAGVEGLSTGTGNAGVEGINNNSSGYGVIGSSTDGYGVTGFSSSGYAGYFNTNVQVTGTLSAGVKNFKIDHPLDPANKYLVHSCIESSEMINLYRGNVRLDANGHAVVTVPDWFEALNKNISYQLTCVGGFAPVYISQELHDHQFEIAGGQASMKVCWQITGERQDAYAKAHLLVVEQVKPEGERGKYLHPVELGFPEQLGIDYEMTHRLVNPPTPHR